MGRCVGRVYGADGARSNNPQVLIIMSKAEKIQFLKSAGCWVNHTCVGWDSRIF